jgi:hypothetical protein
VAAVSDTTIWRWVRTDANRPWAHRSWIFPRDPDFEAKAGRVLDLYAGTWEARPLGKRDSVLSADEKTSESWQAGSIPVRLRDLHVPNFRNCTA